MFEVCNYTWDDIHRPALVAAIPWDCEDGGLAKEFAGGAVLSVGVDWYGKVYAFTKDETIALITDLAESVGLIADLRSRIT